MNPNNKPLRILELPLLAVLALFILQKRRPDHYTLEERRDVLRSIQTDLRAFPLPVSRFEHWLISIVFEALDREYSKIIDLADQGVTGFGRVRADRKVEEIGE